MGEKICLLNAIIQNNKLHEKTCLVNVIMCNQHSVMQDMNQVGLNCKCVVIKYKPTKCTFSN